MSEPLEFQNSNLTEFIRLFFQTVNDLTGYEIQVISEDPLKKQIFSPSSSLFVELDFIGSIVGNLSIFCPFPQLQDMVQDSGEMSKYEKGEMMVSILKEVLNTVAGHMLPRLRRFCPIITLLAPKVIRGNVYYPQISCYSKTVRTSLGEFQFCICIDEKRLEIQELLKETRRMKNEIEKAQEELVQMRKMASLGDVVVGISHEVNTPLGIGVTGITHLIDELKKAQSSLDDLANRENLGLFLEKLDKNADLIFENLKKVTKLMQKFKSITVKKDVDEYTSFDLVAFVKKVLEHQNRLFKDLDIKLEYSGLSELQVSSFSDIFENILSSLFQNSIEHAFEGVKEKKVSVDFSVSKTDFMLSYSDNGKGIETDVQTRIFDPFFTTTRGKGHSTGLGLHIIYNLIIYRLDGKIDCKSSVNGGTQFIIKVPLNKKSH